MKTGEIKAPRPFWKIHPFLFGGLLAAVLVFAYGASRPAPFTVIEISRQPEIFHAREKVWKPLRTGNIVTEKSIVRTDNDSTVSLTVSENLHIKADRATEFKGVGPRFSDRHEDHQIRLFRGRITGATNETFQQRGDLRLFTPNAQLSIRNAHFTILADPQAGRDRLGVLRGEVAVKRRDAMDEGYVFVKELEQIDITREAIHRPTVMQADTWRFAYEAYLLKPRSERFHREQQLLSKRAGNLFDYVYDHGDFFTPGLGYFEREFMVHEESGEVELHAFFDIPIDQSFVGMYMKTRDFHGARFRALEFEIKDISAGEGPQSVYFEVKSRKKVIRSVPIRNISPEWQKVRIPLEVKKPVAVSELVVFLTHGIAGHAKQGTVSLRRFTLIE